MRYEKLTKEELKIEYEKVLAAWQTIKDKKLSLDMSRGKPEKGQLDLCLDMMTNLSTAEDYKNENGFDVRNYGLPTGIPELKRIFADVMQVEKDEIFTGGNSSLNLMYNIIVDAMAIGFTDSDKPWAKYDKIT